ncbi:MAG TPA: DUF1800 domain-containing protein [Rhizomicrobium sp.]|jgi:uncharacterized protein (DUF1800 family)|nr:DUF1800 domain-containing protein [Rhizomicrobium sp.]
MLEKTKALHLSNRLGFGPAPGDLARIADSGFDNYIQTQLHPQITTLPEDVAVKLRSLPSFGKDCATLYAQYWWKAQVPGHRSVSPEEKQKLKGHERHVLREAQIARLARAVGSPWQLQEALVEFWFNHFNVYHKKGPVRVWIGAYEEEAIRPYTLGKFSEILFATAKHPAMLVYLDNAKNVAPAAAGDATDEMTAGDGSTGKKKKERGINENYAREVMELHTLGVNGGYSQADVVALAHILTGWTLGPGGEADAAAIYKMYGKNKGAFRFSRGEHDASQEELLGRTFSGGDIGEGEQALLMLARHPATAHHISYQLAQYFIADAPDSALVADMAKAFRTSDGDIRTVVHTMFTHPSFLAPANIGTKYKTPYGYIVSAARAAGIGVGHIEKLNGALTDLGQPLYGCVSPDGYACTQAAWLDANGLLHRISFAIDFGNGVYSGFGSNGDFDAPDPGRILQAIGPALSKKTLNVALAAPAANRTGAIVGSPDFMRC